MAQEAATTEELAGSAACGDAAGGGVRACRAVVPARAACDVDGEDTARDEAGRGASRPRWYLVATRRGSERAVAHRLTRVAGAALAEPAFVPAYEAELKVRGRWVRAERPLIEGYVVAVTADPDALRDAASLAGPSCRLVCAGGEPVPLPREAEALLGGLGEPGRRVVALSRGVKRGDGSFVVGEGPLRGREALVERVDRHRSLAYLRVDVGGEPVRARVGLALLPEGAADAARSAMPEGWASARLEGVA